MRKLLTVFFVTCIVFTPGCVVMQYLSNAFDQGRDYTMTREDGTKEKVYLEPETSTSTPQGQMRSGFMDIAMGLLTGDGIQVAGGVGLAGIGGLGWWKKNRAERKNKAMVKGVEEGADTKTKKSIAKAATALGVDKDLAKTVAELT